MTLPSTLPGFTCPELPDNVSGDECHPVHKVALAAPGPFPFGSHVPMLRPGVSPGPKLAILSEAHLGPGLLGASLISEEMCWEPLAGSSFFGD